jgi:CBS domain containing-hemolysin-like protein
MFSLVVLVCAILSGSALMSMIEAALLSLPFSRARALVNEGRRNSKSLLEVKKDIHITIASIVIINNSLNVAGSIFIGEKVSQLFGDRWLGLSAMVVTLMIIIFGEVIPKTIGERFKVRLSLFFAPFVRLLVFVLRPAVIAILKLEQPIAKAMKSPTPKVTEEEIKIMLELARAEGTVEIDEEVLINRIFKLNDLRAAQIMKPIDKIYALPADKTLEELKDTLVNVRYSRIAVYDKDPLDIVGIVQHRVLLREIARDNDKAKIGEYMTAPLFVSAATKADELLEKFQVHQQHMFIVQDEHKRDIGIVTMEDVLEELFGEIYDEKDSIKPKVPIP